MTASVRGGSWQLRTSKVTSKCNYSKCYYYRGITSTFRLWIKMAFSLRHLSINRTILQKPNCLKSRFDCTIRGVLATLHFLQQTPNSLSKWELPPPVRNTTFAQLSAGGTFVHCCNEGFPNFYWCPFSPSSRVYSSWRPALIDWESQLLFGLRSH